MDEFEGVEMPNCVQKIIPRERLQVDADRLAEVYLRVGTERGEQRVERTLTDLTCLLDHLRAVSRTGRLGATARSAGQLHSAAETLGLTSLQRVATDVQRLCQTHDPTALNAVLMRLDRVADSSIKVISELQAEIS